jgi:hypothetical protein
MKLSNQALGSIMMALQKSIITQTDITETLKEFVFVENESLLLEVQNPPTFEVPDQFLSEQEGD